MTDKAEELGELSTEAADPKTFDLDQMQPGVLVQTMHRADVESVSSLATELDRIATAIEMIASRMRRGGRLFYLGAGTSGRLGVLDAAECPPTYNSAPEMVQGVIAGGDRALFSAVEGAEDDAKQGAADLAARNFRQQDSLVGIAASGRTPYVLGGLAMAHQLGAWTVGLSCVPGSLVAQAADLAITPATGAEIVTGSTRLKAGTATKLVLNMISTGVMVRLGYVYGNLMVNVQMSNAKLADRAARIVSTLTGLEPAEAKTLLDQAGSVRTAVVMHRLAQDRVTAETRLEEAGGRLRDVVG